MPPPNKQHRRRPSAAPSGGPNAKRPRRADAEAAEIAELEARISATKPARGSDAGIAPEKAAAAAAASNGGGGGGSGNASAVSAAVAADASAPPPASSASHNYPPMAGRRRFDELPLTRATLHGLSLSGYTTMTAVQRAALPHALAGRDVLGAAKTGSGKTLAFVVPLLESLRRARWSPMDGLGGLILSPTRELGTQIFSTLGRVGRQGSGQAPSSAVLSAGLLVGGRDVREEALRVSGLTILVATPGRLLQHMDESPGFDAGRLQVLVLDEADRLLDMGFAPTLDAILSNLPRPRAAVEAELAKRAAKKGGAPLLAPLPSSSSSASQFGGHDGRQTLLFSATQTKRVADLARLSLRDPERVSVHELAPSPTPPRLRQAFAVVALPDKADVLWAFIKSHLNSRVVVFFATCKQVRFFHEALRRLRPGTPLRALHGGMKQGARAAAFEQFVGDVTGKKVGSSSSASTGKKEKKSSTTSSGSGVLLATDVAARGLDFPAVDWVLQVDAPDDAATYVHRVGRTARYTAKGRALMLLTPSEKEGCVSRLGAAGVQLSEVKINPAKGAPVTPALAALLSKAPDLKQAAQRAVQSYARSIALQPDKATFDVRSMPVGEFAASLGLAVAPRMRFLAKAGKKAEKAGEEEEEEEENESGEGGSDGGSETEEEEGAAPSKAVAAESDDGDSGDDDDLMVVKRRDVFEDDDDDGETERAAAAAPTTPGQLALDSSKLSKRKKKKLRIPVKGGAASVASGERLVFDDEGRAAPPLSLLGEKLEFGGNGSGSDGEEDEKEEAKEGKEEKKTERKKRGFGLDVGEHADAEARLDSAAAALRERDSLDKEDYARGRRERRLEKKLKAKARARGEEEEQRGAVRLNGGAGSSSEEEEDESDFASSSSDDDEGPSARAPPRAVPDAGHAGMARRGEELASRMREKGGSNGGGANGGRSGDLAETEALALRLLAARRRG